MQMTEELAREIYTATELTKYDYSQLEEADRFVKDYALRSLKYLLNRESIVKPMRDFIMLMARCHYGSVETDQFLTAMKCYPDWVREGGRA